LAPERLSSKPRDILIESQHLHDLFLNNDNIPAPSHEPTTQFVRLLTSPLPKERILCSNALLSRARNYAIILRYCQGDPPNFQRPTSKHAALLPTAQLRRGGELASTFCHSSCIKLQFLSHSSFLLSSLCLLA